MSENFIREFQDKVNWFAISRFQTLSENFIREFKSKVEWSKISQYQILSEDFIREFENQLDWYFISRYQNLSEEFLIKFKKKIDWIAFFEHHQEVSFLIMLKFLSKAGYKSLKGFKTTHLTNFEIEEINKHLKVKNLFKIKETI